MSTQPLIITNSVNDRVYEHAFVIKDGKPNLLYREFEFSNRSKGNEVPFTLYPLGSDSGITILYKDQVKSTDYNKVSFYKKFNSSAVYIYTTIKDIVKSNPNIIVEESPSSFTNINDYLSSVYETSSSFDYKVDGEDYEVVLKSYILSNGKIYQELEFTMDYIGSPSIDGGANIRLKRLSGSSDRFDNWISSVIPTRYLSTLRSGTSSSSGSPSSGGSSNVDLSNYFTKSEVLSKLSTKADKSTFENPAPPYVTVYKPQTVEGEKTFSRSIHCDRNVYAEGFYETSLRKLKTNITDFDKSGLKLVNGLKIVSYDKINGVKNKIGIIADDTTDEFLSESKEQVDLYNTIFIQAKAIQELTKEVNNLKELLNEISSR